MIGDDVALYEMAESKRGHTGILEVGAVCADFASSWSGMISHLRPSEEQMCCDRTIDLLEFLSSRLYSMLFDIDLSAAWVGCPFAPLK